MLENTFYTPPLFMRKCQIILICKIFEVNFIPEKTTSQFFVKKKIIFGNNPGHLRVLNWNLHISTGLGQVLAFGAISAKWTLNSFIVQINILSHSKIQKNFWDFEHLNGQDPYIKATNWIISFSYSIILFRISWKELGQHFEKSRPWLISSLKRNLRQGILTQ